MSARAAIACLGAVLLTGCRIGGSTGLDKVADELRAQNHDLKGQVESLMRQNAELGNKLRALGAGEQVLASPALAGITIDRYSGWQGAERRFVVYLSPYDGRGRFVPLIGRVRLSAGDVTREFDAAQVQDAYRSGFMGTHYAFELSGVPDGMISVTAEFTSGSARATASAQLQ